MRKLISSIPLLSIAVFSVPSFAGSVDVAAVVTDIGAQVGPITLIGGAVLLVSVATAAFVWVRRAL